MEHPEIKAYTPAAIEQIHRSLLLAQSQGSAKKYSVEVDELEVIPRTSDPAHLERYGEFIEEHNHRLIIKLWNGTSNTYKRYTFRLHEEPAQPSGELGGLNLDARINERLEAERKSWQLTQLEQQVEALEGEVAEQAEYIDELETAVADLSTKKPSLGGIDLGALSSAVIEGMIRRNPQIIAKLPGGEALAGIIEEDNAQAQQGPPPDQGKASFKMKTKDAASAPATDDKLVQFANELRNSFSAEELVSIQALLAMLEQDHSLILPAIEYVLNKSKASGTEPYQAPAPEVSNDQ